MYEEKIGLVFAGGGGKGAYEIGVWKALKEYKIADKISVVCGTSVGGLNAVLFAQGDYELAENIWNNISKYQILSPNYTSKIDEIKSRVKNEYESYASSFFSRDGLKKIIDENVDWEIIEHKGITCLICCLKIMDKNQCNQVVKLLKGIWEAFPVSRGINRTCDAIRLLYKYLDAKYIGNCIPKYFNIVHEQENREKILLATSAIPIVYSDVMIDGSYYVDGGLKDNTPINAALEEGCTTIYVVSMSRTEVIPVTINYNNRIVKIISIKPNNSQGGFFDGLLDFNPENAKKRIEDGYQDAVSRIKMLEAERKLCDKDRALIKEMHRIENKRKRNDKLFS